MNTKSPPFISAPVRSICSILGLTEIGLKRKLNKPTLEFAQKYEAAEKEIENGRLKLMEMIKTGEWHIEGYEFAFARFNDRHGYTFYWKLANEPSYSI